MILTQQLQMRAALGVPLHLQHHAINMHSSNTLGEGYMATQPKGWTYHSSLLYILAIHRITFTLATTYKCTLPIL